MNKFYRKLEVPDFDRIQKTLVPVILDIVGNREHKLRINPFTESEYLRIQQQVPELFDSIFQITQSDIQSFVFLYYDENYPTSGTAHSDLVEQDFETGVIPDYFYRLNWPILNPESFETVFFRETDSDARYYDEVAGAYKLDETKLERVDTLVMSSPALVNIKEPHGIYKIEENLPRILLAIRPVDGDSPRLRNLAVGSEHIS